MTNNNLNNSQEVKLSVADLGYVAETLLIPLAARAQAEEIFPKLGFSDPLAKRLLSNLAVDPKRFSNDHNTIRGTIARVRWFDKITRNFLSSNPKGLCVNIGAGLDSRSERVNINNYPDAKWRNMDLPEVIALRKKLLPKTSCSYDIAGDLQDASAKWIDELPWQGGQPALFMAEGVLLYFCKEEAEAVITNICKAAEKRKAPLFLAIDYSSPLMVKNSKRHPSVKKTKATFKWAVKSPEDLYCLDSKLKVIDKEDIMFASGIVPGLFGFIHKILTGGRWIYGCILMQRKEK